MEKKEEKKTAWKGRKLKKRRKWKLEEKGERKSEKEGKK